MSIHADRPKPAHPRTATAALWVCNALIFACGAAWGAVVL